MIRKDSKIYANVAVTDLQTKTPRGNIEKNDLSRMKGTRSMNDSFRFFFPLRLFDVINDEKNSQIITWLPSGKGFIIVDKKRFTAEVLPLHFKQIQFSSFTRKLSRWDFTRISRGPLIGAYYHEFFQKGQPLLCSKMRCKDNPSKFEQISSVRPQTHDCTIPSKNCVSKLQQIASVSSQGFQQNHDSIIPVSSQGFHQNHDSIISATKCISVKNSAEKMHLAILKMKVFEMERLARQQQAQFESDRIQMQEILRRHAWLTKLAKAKTSYSFPPESQNLLVQTIDSSLNECSIINAAVRSTSQVSGK